VDQISRRNVGKLAIEILNLGRKGPNRLILGEYHG
jgi:hypothetical protein